MLHVVARRGIDVGHVLDECNLPSDFAAQGEPTRIGLEQMRQLLRQLWRESDDELMRLGAQPVPLGSFRLLSFAMHGAPTLGDHLDRFAELQPAIPGYPNLVVETQGPRATVGFDLAEAAGASGIVTNVLLSMMHGYMSWAVGATIPLLGVRLPPSSSHDDDAAAERSRTDRQAVFGAPVRADTEYPRMIIASSWLDAPSSRSEEHLRLMVHDSMLNLVMYTYARPRASDDVRRFLVARGMNGSLPGVDEISQALHVSPQTLRRRMREEGTTPRQVREELMRDLAIAALTTPGSSVAAVGRQLGFAEPSAFSRAFRRWTGSSPNTYLALPSPRESVS